MTNEMPENETPFDATEDEGAFGITDHELLALASMSGSDPARRSLDAVGIAPLLEDEALVRAGYATLMVRGLAVVEDEMIAAQDAANAIAAIMAEAVDVYRLIITSGGEPVMRTVFINAAEGSFLLDMSGVGAHTAQPLEPGQNIPDIIFDAVSELGSGQVLPLPIGVEVSHHTAAGTRTVNFTVGQQGWSMKAGGAQPIQGSPQSVWATARTLLG
ncbi:hypothetical protein [Nigerium massiliense]|uniref:hypothetical protein n=1 Tax=Nigerium massiliense TaxID=1522317 RepID=UPI00058B8ABF|nr:hypothetical protein [Nigerium massiliense]